MSKSSILSSAFRSVLTKLMNEVNFGAEGDFSLLTRPDFQEKYKTIINNSNSFFIICNYKTAQYEYVSENIKDQLGYDVSGFSPQENTNLIFSIIDEQHLKFLFDSMLPVVLQYFKENATQLTGTDYRYTCSFKAKNIYGKYEWYLIDTAIVQVDEHGFPLKTLITCTNINQFKKDSCIYYNVLKKNQDGVYEVMLEGTANNELDAYKLTHREIQIINLIGEGYSNKLIADKLSITLHTVQSHRKNIVKKTQCRGTAELTNFAFSRGLL